jgi:hypothetical protein
MADVGCSILTSFDNIDLDDGNAGRGGASTPDVAAGRAGAMSSSGGTTAGVLATSGGAVVATGGVMSATGGVVVATGGVMSAKGGASSCNMRGRYCGGDKVTGDPNTLYECTDGSSATIYERCSNGCSVNPQGYDDECNILGSGNCTKDGFYCGGDKVTGERHTLYVCISGSSGTQVEYCEHGCSVKSGINDSCNDLVSGDCTKDGFYCGGDKVTGDRDRLYVCILGDSGTPYKYCPHGCAFNPTGNDDCNP